MEVATKPSLSIHATQGRAPLAAQANRPAPSASQVEGAEKTRDAFSKFVGTTVFGQMLSSMRKTVGEPAYFDGGQAEKMFQGQLDQAIADELTARGGSAFSKAMFDQQFPHLSDILRRDAVAESEAAESGAVSDAKPLDQLAALRRR